MQVDKPVKIPNGEFTAKNNAEAYLLKIAVAKLKKNVPSPPA